MAGGLPAKAAAWTPARQWQCRGGEKGASPPPPRPTTTTTLKCALPPRPPASPGFFIQSSIWEKVTNHTSYFWVAYSMKAMAAWVLSCGRPRGGRVRGQGGGSVRETSGHGALQAPAAAAFRMSASQPRAAATHEGEPGGVHEQGEGRCGAGGAGGGQLVGAAGRGARDSATASRVAWRWACIPFLRCLTAVAVVGLVESLDQQLRGLVLRLKRVAGKAWSAHSSGLRATAALPHPQ